MMMGAWTPPLSTPTWAERSTPFFFFFSTCGFDALTLLVLLLLQFCSSCWQTALSLYLIALLSAFTYMALTQQ